jgi:ABC-type lipoprotein export system ATPase subunit
VIHLRRIRREFPVGDEKVVALRDVDLDIAAGDYVAIVGPSGSGKSSLLNVIGLLDQADSGEYLLARRGRCRTSTTAAGRNSADTR